MRQHELTRSLLIVMAWIVATPPGLFAQASEDVTGRYEFKAELRGQNLDGVIELTRSGGAGVTGQLRLGSLPPAEVTAATPNDTGVILDIRLPEGPGSAILRMQSDAVFSGEIRIGSNRIAIAGRKTRTGPPAEIDAWLPYISRRVEEMAATALREAGEAGLAVAAVDDGTEWIGGYGHADKAEQDAVTGETIFQVGSISKLLTAWGVMRLVDAGVIGLDVPVNQYLERWKVPADQFDASQVTTRRLLSHTAGLNVPSIAGVDTTEAVPDLVTEIEGRGRGDEWRVRVVRPPGSEFAYSGGGYMVLQLLLEEVTGRPFADYMREEVLLPLGMRDSYFGWNDVVAARVATPHSPNPERDRRHRHFAGLAGAGLYTTAQDLARLMSAHFGGASGEPPGRGVVKPQSLLLMMATDDIAESYGLGYEVYPLSDGRRAVGHGGSNIGWKANLILVPELKAGFAAVSNADEGRARAAVLQTAQDGLARLRPTSPPGRR